MPPQDPVVVPVELDVVLILGFSLGVHTLKHEYFTKSQLALSN